MLVCIQQLPPARKLQRVVRLPLCLPKIQMQRCGTSMMRAVVLVQLVEALAKAVAEAEQRRERGLGGGDPWGPPLQA